MKTLNFLMATVLTVSLAASADENPADKEAAIAQLIQVAGIGQQVTALFTRQMIQALKTDYPEIPDTIIQSVEEEVALAVSEEIEKGTLQQTIYPIYAKHFTIDEIRELIAFNNSALGKKANRLMPQLMQESSLAAQQWSLGLRVKLLERVSEKLREKGLNILIEPRPSQ